MIAGEVLFVPEEVTDDQVRESFRDADNPELLAEARRIRNREFGPIVVRLLAVLLEADDPHLMRDVIASLFGAACRRGITDDTICHEHHLSRAAFEARKRNVLHQLGLRTVPASLVMSGQS